MRILLEWKGHNIQITEADGKEVMRVLLAGI